MFGIPHNIWPLIGVDHNASKMSKPVELATM